MGTVQYNIKLLAQNYKTIFSNKKEACDKNSSLWACACGYYTVVEVCPHDCYGILNIFNEVAGHTHKIYHMIIKVPK